MVAIMLGGVVVQLAALHNAIDGTIQIIAKAWWLPKLSGCQILANW